jgi:hypothetical protein
MDKNVLWSRLRIVVIGGSEVCVCLGYRKRNYGVIRGHMLSIIICMNSLGGIIWDLVVILWLITCYIVGICVVTGLGMIVGSINCLNVAVICSSLPILEVSYCLPLFCLPVCILQNGILRINYLFCWGWEINSWGRIC